MNAEHSISSSFQGGRCLSTVAMRQYIDGTLPKASLHQVEKHLVDCDFCSQILEDMDVSEEGKSTIQVIAQNVNKRILERAGFIARPGFWVSYRKQIIGAGSLLLLIGGILLVAFSSNEKEHASDISPVKQNIQQSVPTPSNNAEVKKPVADEFPTHVGDAVPGSKETAETKPLKTATDEAGGINSKSDATDAAAGAAAVSPIPAGAPATASPSPVDPKKEIVKPEVVDKENYASLQIISVKVLQKMSKATQSGSTRKRTKNGQLPAPTDKNGAYFLLDDMPSYPGGDEAMEEYIVSNFKNPVKDKRSLSGKAVGVMFTVSSRGRVSEAEITHSVSPELDVEILRLISTMPSWNPGKHIGDISCVLVVTVR